MYETILVLNWAVGKKTPGGTVISYNTTEKYVKTISGLSEEDCINKVKQFLSEAEFVSIKGKINE